jgi:hypothetical protein
MVMVTKKFVKEILSNGGYLLGLDNNKYNNAICGFKTKGFKSRTVNGDCAYFNWSKAKPVVGLKYLVRAGDPEEFRATYLGNVNIRLFEELKKHYEMYSGWSKPMYNSSENVSVFEQDGEYLVYYRDFCEFVKELK